MTTGLFYPGLVPLDAADITRLLAHSAPARRRFDRASEVLGYPLAEALRDCGEEDWEVVDNACLTSALALSDSAEEWLDPAPELCTGISFGGLPAVVRAGGLDFADALVLVTRSARIQTRFLAERPEPGACLFLIGLTAGQVRALADRLAAEGHWIEVSAQLGRDIHAVSAAPRTLELFQEAMREHGGRGFHTMNRPQHCRMLEPLRAELERDVYRVTPFHRARLPVLSDIDGTLLREPEDLRTFLLAGWVEPVSTDTTVAGLRAASVDRLHLAGSRNLFGRLLGGVCELVPIGYDSPAVAAVPA
ncbi:ACP S-malonyltransferase [Kitasatospora sp. NPDC054939]